MNPGHTHHAHDRIMCHGPDNPVHSFATNQSAGKEKKGTKKRNLKANDERRYVTTIPSNELGEAVSS